MSRATVDLQAVRFFLGYGLIFFTQNLITVVIVVDRALVLIDWQLALIAFADRAGADRSRRTATPASATRC